MPGSTGPDNNTYTIPEVQLGDTFNFWRDATNTAIYKLNKLKIYDATSSGSIGVTYGSTGVWNAFLAPTITEGLTFTQRIVFSNGISAAGVYSSRGITAIAGIWTTGGLSADRLYVGGGSTFASGLYVGGGATFASTASVSGNFAVNTNNLVVNTSNSRVGVGTASPGASLDVNGLVRIVNAGTTGGGSGVVHPLQIVNDPGTISAFLGDGTSTSAYKGNSYSAALRFNGAGVAWGDIAYYPQGRTGGFVSGGGEFRFVKSGGVVTPTANAMVSVGELLSEGQIYAGATGTFATNVSVGSVLTVTGTLGIGTATPTSAIHINKSSSGPVGLYVNNSSNNAYGTIYANGSVGAAGSWANGFAIESVPFSTGNFILSAFTNDMVFQTNMGAARTEVMRLKAGGSLGIGTASPARKVHVQSGDDTLIRVQGPSGKANGIEFTDGTYLTQAYAAGATYTFAHASAINHYIGSDKAFYYAGGSFGIGVYPTSPKLHVFTNGGTSIYGESSGPGSSTNYGVHAVAAGFAGFNTGLYVNVGNATNNYGIRIVNPPVAASSWAIYSDATAQSYFAGNIGIGTATPAHLVHVYGSNPSVNIENTASSSGSGGSIIFGHNQGSGAGITLPIGKISAFLTNGGAASTRAGHLQFFTSNAGTLTERLRITDTGNVGIGVDTPGATLDVLGGDIHIRSSAGTYASPNLTRGIISYNYTSGIFTLDSRSNGSNSTMSFRTTNSGTNAERVSIGSTGIVTISANTASTSASTGALVVTGGLGVGALSTFAGITSSAIISCATAPTQGQHLANKTYVDGRAKQISITAIGLTFGNTSLTSSFVYTIPSNCFMLNGYAFISMAGNNGSKIRARFHTADTANAGNAVGITFDLCGMNDALGGDGGAGLSGRPGWCLGIPSTATHIRFVKATGRNYSSSEKTGATDIELGINQAFISS